MNSLHESPTATGSDSATENYSKSIALAFESGPARRQIAAHFGGQIRTNTKANKEALGHFGGRTTNPQKALIHCDLLGTSANFVTPIARGLISQTESKAMTSQKERSARITKDACGLNELIEKD